MPSFRNIVLFSECDESTLNQAAELARTARGRLTVLQVVKPLPHASRELRIGDRDVDVERLLVRDSTAALKSRIAPLRKRGIRATARVRVGNASLEIIRDVIANRRDLVIMTAEGKGRLRERLFGSTSQRLLRACPRPVWIRKPARRGGFGRLLAAVDPDPDDATRTALNTTILRLSAALAVSAGAEFHVVHAWGLIGEAMMRFGAGISETELRDLTRRERELHLRLTRELLAAASVAPTRLHMVKGAAERVVPSLVQSEQIDLLVMGTVGRTGIAGFIIGNTAEQILDEVDCSVLAVKPEGFVSPVKLT